MADALDEVQAAWAARALMAICDEARTWQAGDGSIYDPALVTVTDAANVVGRLVAGRLVPLLAKAWDGGASAVRDDFTANVGRPLGMCVETVNPFRRETGDQT